MSTTEPLWTLEELAGLVAKALSVDYAGQASGRVRDVPNARTIRYYSTLGLLDRAAELRGRTAYYGRRHLLQLVAIKRLQAQAFALAQVQERLLGIPTAALARIANVPAEVIEAESATRRVEPASSASRRREAFWKAAPAHANLHAPLSFGHGAQAPLTLQSIPLDGGASLLLVACTRQATEDDARAIRKAAAHLLKLLETRGLVRKTEGASHE